MAFELGKEQVTERDALAAELRKQRAALNVAIAAFNQAANCQFEAFDQAFKTGERIIFWLRGFPISR